MQVDTPTRNASNGKGENTGNTGSATGTGSDSIAPPGACCEELLGATGTPPPYEQLYPNVSPPGGARTCDNPGELNLGDSEGGEPQNVKRKSSTASGNYTPSWKPVLLVIPLRLGLTEINPMYIHSLKVGVLKTLKQATIYIS